MLEENCFKLFWKSTRLIGFMVVLFALLLLSACTDYLQDIDDKYDEWLARTESAAKSSSSVTKSSSSEKIKSSSSALVLSSSISAKTSSSINASSSSVKGSSSSKKTISSSSSAKFSSSSKKLEYSSSSAAPSNTGGGTCAPANPIVEQDEVVIWKYTVGGSVKTTDMLSANLKWSTPGATPESLDGKGAKFMSDTVKYATSGQHTATLSLSTAKGSFNLNCAPVQVNGTKITGCKCETAAKSVNFKTTPGVEWGVSGCSTGADLVLSYEWDGAPGAASFTKTFTAATDAYAPKLYVKNNDNTMVEVTCPSVKITDGPEFEITTTQGAGAIKLPKGTSEVFLNVDALHNTVFCIVNRDDSPSGALNGTVNKTAIKGSDYIAVSMPAGTLVKGAMLEFTLSVPAKCGVQ